MQPGGIQRPPPGGWAIAEDPRLGALLAALAASGETATGRVIGEAGPGLYLFTLRGRTLVAASDLPLRPDQTVRIQAEPAEGGQVRLRLAADADAAVPDDPIRQRLAALGLPDSPAARQAVAAFAELGAPLDAGRIAQAIAAALRARPDAASGTDAAAHPGAQPPPGQPDDASSTAAAVVRAHALAARAGLPASPPVLALAARAMAQALPNVAAALAALAAEEPGAAPAASFADGRTGAAGAASGAAAGPGGAPSAAGPGTAQPAPAVPSAATPEAAVRVAGPSRVAVQPPGPAVPGTASVGPGAAAEDGQALPAFRDALAAMRPRTPPDPLRPAPAGTSAPAGRDPPGRIPAGHSPPASAVTGSSPSRQATAPAAWSGTAQPGASEAIAGGDEVGRGPLMEEGRRPVAEAATSGRAAIPAAAGAASTPPAAERGAGSSRQAAPGGAPEARSGSGQPPGGQEPRTAQPALPTQPEPGAAGRSFGKSGPDQRPGIAPGGIRSGATEAGAGGAARGSEDDRAQGDAAPDGAAAPSRPGAAPRSPPMASPPVPRSPAGDAAGPPQADADAQRTRASPGASGPGQRPGIASEELQIGTAGRSGGGAMRDVEGARTQGGAAARSPQPGAAPQSQPMASLSVPRASAGGTQQGDANAQLARAFQRGGVATDAVALRMPAQAPASPPPTSGPSAVGGMPPGPAGGGGTLAAAEAPAGPPAAWSGPIATGLRAAMDRPELGFPLPDPIREGAAGILRALVMAGVRLLPEGAAPAAEPPSPASAPPHADGDAAPRAERGSDPLPREPAAAPVLKALADLARSERAADPPAAPPPAAGDLSAAVARAAREAAAETVFKPAHLDDYDAVVALPLLCQGQPTPARLAVASRAAAGGARGYWVRVDAELSHLGPLSVRLSGADHGPVAIIIVAESGAARAIAAGLDDLARDLDGLGLAAGIRVAAAGEEAA